MTEWSEWWLWQCIKFAAATYLVWAALFWLIDPWLGLLVSSVVMASLVLAEVLSFFRFLWLPILCASLVSWLVHKWLRKRLKPGFLVGLGVNGTFILTILGAGEAVSLTAMHLDAWRQNVECMERHSFPFSVFALRSDPLERPISPHSHARAVWEDRRALWSYKTMSFEETDKEFQIPLSCEVTP